MTGQNAPTKIDVIPLTENPADAVASASADTVVKNVTAHGLCVGTGLCNRDRNGVAAPYDTAASVSIARHW